MCRVNHQKVGASVFVAGLVFGGTSAYGQWIVFENQTGDRLIASSNIGANDDQERHYAWGDVNNNGWIDLAVARKSPFTTTGLRRNVLFMNEEGTLVDRTEEYASAAVVDGHSDDGFLTPTNDRRVIMVDVNNNGWYDMVTATTLSFGQHKHIAYPRVYVNQTEDARGNWLGFVFEDDRIPQFEGNASNGMPHAPRFCGLGAGDVTGNGYADLYFADYDSGNDGGSFDFNDRLLVNQGGGYFEDESWRIPTPWLSTNFGTSAHIADINGSGVNDIIRSNSLGGYNTDIFYNNPNDEGHFVVKQTPSAASGPYFVNVADLNNNGRLDMVVVTDGTDRVLWNQSTSGLEVNWTQFTLPNSSGVDGNKIVFADLNQNGYKDIVIAGNDPDFTGCRTAHIHRNNQDGTFSRNFGNIPSSQLQGSFHIAAFDINGNGWPDLVVGRCAGTSVWMNQPTFGVDFLYLTTLPSIVEPGEPVNIKIRTQPFGDTIDQMNLHYSLDDGDSFTPIPMALTGEETYEADIPGAECGTKVLYYVEATLTGGSVITDPMNAPAETFNYNVVADLVTTFSDDMGPPAPDSGWVITSEDSLTQGEWEAAVPNPVFVGANLAAPDGDASSDPEGMAFVTGNCAPGFPPPASCNIQGGATYLDSPVIDLAGTDARISYDRWFFSSSGRVLRTEVSNDDGQTWIFVEQTSGTSGDWKSASFIVGDYVEPTDQIRVRFWTQDSGTSSITNAGIDNFAVEVFTCDDVTPCVGDLTGDGQVGVPDLLALIGQWGSCPDTGECTGDLTGNGSVGVPDLLVLINNWGACPN